MALQKFAITFGLVYAREIGTDGTLSESGSCNGPALFYISDSGAITGNLPREGHVLHDLSPYYCIEIWARKLLDDIGKEFSGSDMLEEVMKMQEALVAWLGDTEYYNRHAPKIVETDPPEKKAREIIKALDATFHGKETIYGTGVE
jgi:hypothetical protein